MARALRVQYAGAVYHVTCRGNEKRDIFRDDTDRKQFLKILIQSLNIYTIKLYSYMLMNNHFHLLLETPFGNLGEFMRHFNITYTGYHNRRHKRVGHLYQGRYKSILVEKDMYLSVLSRYIHLNPIRTKAMAKSSFKEKIQFLKQYRWSSLPGYIDNRKKERYIDYSMVLEQYGGDIGKGRNAYKKRIYADIREDIEVKDRIIGQSILGGDSFIEWIKEKFLEGKEDRELPSLKEIHTYLSKDEILKAIEEESGKSIEEIKIEKGSLRQIAIELLYRVGGLKGEEIGRMMGVGYTSISQERKRLREKLQKDKCLKEQYIRIEEKCHK